MDLDGATVAPIPGHGLARPLLTGWKRWLVVADAVHASFTDLALLADQVGLDVGTGIAGARSLDITRGYVRAFFDHTPLSPAAQPRFTQQPSRWGFPYRLGRGGGPGFVIADTVPPGTRIRVTITGPRPR
jgi:hypothetical protein